MQLQAATEDIVSILHSYLSQIDEAAYSRPIEALSNSTLGQHTRHTIEFFQCITEQSPSGVLSYDERVRNPLVERSPKAALEELEKISKWFQAPRNTDKQLLLRISLSPDNPESIEMPSSFMREWTYAVEHAIHHMAIIRIGAKFVAPGLQLPDHFGVAPSTIKYRNKKCVQ